jgi:hypothetical protein
MTGGRDAVTKISRRVGGSEQDVTTEAWLVTIPRLPCSCTPSFPSRRVDIVTMTALLKSLPPVGSSPEGGNVTSTEMVARFSLGVATLTLHAVMKSKYTVTSRRDIMTTSGGIATSGCHGVMNSVVSVMSPGVVVMETEVVASKEGVAQAASTGPATEKTSVVTN